MTKALSGLGIARDWNSRKFDDGLVCERHFHGIKVQHSSWGAPSFLCLLNFKERVILNKSIFFCNLCILSCRICCLVSWIGRMVVGLVEHFLDRLNASWFRWLVLWIGSWFGRLFLDWLIGLVDLVDWSLIGWMGAGLVDWLVDWFFIGWLFLDWLIGLGLVDWSWIGWLDCLIWLIGLLLVDCSWIGWLVKYWQEMISRSSSGGRGANFCQLLRPLEA